MSLLNDASTNPSLLNEVADWQNLPAWLSFRCQYDPLLRRWCRGFGLEHDSVDEICQRIWIELADRMRTFQYDPNRSFRGWLRQVCRSRVLDFLRQRKSVRLLSFDERDDDVDASETVAAIDSSGSDHSEGVADPFRLFLLDEAEKVQRAVRGKVSSQTWDAFWLVAVCDWPVERTAKALGMTHTAVYAARERVARMLADEGKHVSDCWPAGA